MSKTIQQSIAELHTSLSEYIEATYHIGHPGLINQRRQLLAEQGVIHQSPYLESTPRYAPGRRFSEIVGLPASARQLYEALSVPQEGRGPIFYDPPYDHQAGAIEHALVGGKNLIIMTGTGSGKTESFLLPILGKLAREAAESPSSFAQPAVRAILLYPMNALVNDQIGRLRTLFGSAELAQLFFQWAGRRPRFARYTSRTPYAGVRTARKDQRRLKSFEEFFVEMEIAADDVDSAGHEAAARVRGDLKRRGKWPGKPDLRGWYGEKGTAWQDRRTGEFLRAVTLPEDAELVTRDEVQTAAPDLLVTNYSMLEYMLMRPIERPIFDETRRWLAENPQERVLVVLDEAHLYRGAAGAEVGLLVRRLRERLEVGPERLQVICATASFEDREHAPDFGAQLSGAPPETFEPITSNFAFREGEADGSAADAAALAAVDLSRFYESAGDADQSDAVSPLLQHRGVVGGETVEVKLFNALKDFPPLARLVNSTMGRAQPISELGAALFPPVDPELADQAITALLALGSRARLDADTPGLLPCRVHTFFRGLPGLWACMDSDCSELSEAERGGPTGKLYGQPHERCRCGSRILEFFTCRNCGGSYARAYTNDVVSPSALWSKPGRAIRLASGTAAPLQAVDLLLETPNSFDAADQAIYDLETGRLNPRVLGERTRSVYLRPNRTAPPADEDGNVAPTDESLGQFVPCGLCGQRAGFNKSSVQDHQTKGDQPFQTLLSRQIHIQPPGPPRDLRFAPLRGRKVLVFSDSRQVAARLAPNLQMYSVRDSLRPLIMKGFDLLQGHPYIGPRYALSDAFFAAVLAAKALGVRLRPELASGESFDVDAAIERGVAEGALDDPEKLQELWLENRNATPPRSLLEEIVKTITDRWLGLESLALASIAERPNQREAIGALPALAGLPDTAEAKASVVRAWLRCWVRKGVWFDGSPQAWWGNQVKGHQSGRFDAMKRVHADPAARKTFNEVWIPQLQPLFLDSSVSPPRLAAKNVSLLLGGDWVRCPACKSVHRPVAGVSRCLDCDEGTTVPLDMSNDPVFEARKGYYRRGVLEAFAEPPEAPMALIAAEHTAQLNAAQNDNAFSKAEENELLFQDVNIAWRPFAPKAAAIDILSSTTTMEVGIDIGALSGVALRNMPPGRANYQQRAGRAGRRGNAVATVVAFGSADSHDEHYFRQPAEMISGPVVDPRLTLDNPDIVRRHIYAYLLQRYHQYALPDVDPASQPDLFSVLGSVANFRTGRGILNRDDFKNWMEEHADALRARVDGWIPSELSAADRAELLETMFARCLEEIDEAIEYGIPEEDAPPSPPPLDEESPEAGEDPASDGEEQTEARPERAMLLDRLLYSGVLPRYAFPTDVATFHVFDPGRSIGGWPVFSFTPAQGLPIALSQYAPGKQVWISGKCYTSGALYSRSRDELFDSWQNKRLYFECSNCGFAETDPQGGERGDTLDCPACGATSTFGPGRPWIRPVGFAHPVDWPEETSPDSVPESSYATRAKLTMSTPGDEASWASVNPRLKGLQERTFLLVSNTGPESEGYSYCTACGRIEASTEPRPLLGGAHRKPYPTKDSEQMCDGGHTARKIVLGTNFITDIALFSLRVDEPVRLRPGLYSTDVALRTLSEALAKAACLLLEIEPGEILAEYRPALTPGGPTGHEAEVFLYDTLPGGAGFSSQLALRGQELFEKALELLRDCAGECDSSCYRCLRSFKNKFEHGMLDRHLGADLANYLLTGELGGYSASRVSRSNHLLFMDIARQGASDLELAENQDVHVTGLGGITVPILLTRKTDGRKFAACVSGPLTPDRPVAADMQRLMASEFMEVVAVDELMVRMNLPAATLEVRSRLGLSGAN
jgi:ATP-dependent helicase YprA (DUF1998 family)